MVKLKNVKGKSRKEIEGGAYFRCFGDVELSKLFSRVQSLIIKNGFELERIITDKVENLLIRDLDQFLDDQIMRTEGVRVATKHIVKKSKKIKGRGIEPDFLIFQRAGTSQNCYIIELKDGHEFDTKSSAREHANLHQFRAKNAQVLHFYNNYFKIVGFNADTKEEIHKGFKSKFEFEQIMTGAEFCELLGLNYRSIVYGRTSDVEENFENFIEELLSIESVRNSIQDNLCS